MKNQDEPFDRDEPGEQTKSSECNSKLFWESADFILSKFYDLLWLWVIKLATKLHLDNEYDQGYESSHWVDIWTELGLMIYFSRLNKFPIIMVCGWKLWEREEISLVDLQW